MITDTRHLPDGRTEFLILMTPEEIEEAKLTATRYPYRADDPKAQLIIDVFRYDQGRTI